MQPLCPLCRDTFSPQDIRRIRVDSDGDAVSPTTVPSQVDGHLQRLLCDIASAAGENPTVEDIERAIEQCRIYHNTQPDTSGSVRDTVPKHICFDMTD